MTTYMWLLSLVVSAMEAGDYDSLSDYTDDYVFSLVRCSLSDGDRTRVYDRVFGLRVWR